MNKNVQKLRASGVCREYQNSLEGYKRTREQILKSHQKEVGHTLKWKNNPEDILTEPTTPKHTINVHKLRNKNYAHKSENNNML